VLTARIGLESLCSDGAVGAAVAAAVLAVLQPAVEQEHLAEKEASWLASCPLHP
jgi:hypothetical protein